MTEILFTLTTIYVAYVIYSIVNGEKSSIKSAQPEKETPSIIEQPILEMAEPEAIKPKVALSPETGNAVKMAAKTPVPKGSVRDPKSGEVAAVTGNYRFTKRWVKEALVAEGLLGKVYKNNELDADTEVLIKSAIATFITLDKYQA